MRGVSLYQSFTCLARFWYVACALIHSIVQDIKLTERDVEFIAKVTVELWNYLSCLDKIKWVYYYDHHWCDKSSYNFMQWKVSCTFSATCHCAIKCNFSWSCFFLFLTELEDTFSLSLDWGTSTSRRTSHGCWWREVQRTGICACSILLIFMYFWTL